MPDEETTQEEQPQEQAQPDVEEIIKRATQGMRDEIASLKKDLAEARKPPEAPRKPERPAGGSRQEANDYVASIERYAAQQAQRATRFELAQQYKIDPDELDGDYSSPEAMRARAEMLAQEKRLARLEEDLEAERERARKVAEEMSKASSTEPEPEVPPSGVDQGGPTYEQPEQAKALQDLYEQAKAYPRGREERSVRHLMAIYQDPTKQGRAE